LIFGLGSRGGTFGTKVGRLLKELRVVLLEQQMLLQILSCHGITGNKVGAQDIISSGMTHKCESDTHFASVDPKHQLITETPEFT